MSAASRWGRLLAGVGAAGSARLRHAVGSTLRRASIQRIGQAASSALHASRLRHASARPCPASSSSSTLPRLLLHRIREAAASANLRPASSTLLARLRLLRAELAQVRRGPGGLHRLRGAGPQSARGGVFPAFLHRLRPASSEALARLRAASAELLRLVRDDLAALAAEAVEEETRRQTEETAQVVGPAILHRLRALGKTVADVVVDHRRLKNVFERINFMRRKRKEEGRPQPRRPLPLPLVPHPEPATWLSCLRRPRSLPSPPVPRPAPATPARPSRPPACARVPCAMRAEGPTQVAAAVRALPV